MKRVSAIFLFAILLVNAAGFYVYYIVELQTIHLEMRAKIRHLPDEQLTGLVLSSTEYERSLVEEDEIKVKGKMFDVARVKHIGDSVMVFGIYDEKEDDLLALANEIISKPFDQDSDVTRSVLRFISLDFLPGQLLCNVSNHGRQIRHASNYFLASSSPALQCEAPPPRGSFFTIMASAA